MTIYRVAKGRGRDLLLEMLGPEYAGVLVSDCLATYDDVNPRQQKCYSHHLKAIRLAGEDHGPREHRPYCAAQHGPRRS
jgi:hypothetical protein